MFEMTIPVVPVACPRPRVSFNKSKGFARAYYPKKYKVFKSLCVAYVKANMPKGFIKFEKQALALEAVFIMPRPKALQRKKDFDGRIAHQKKPDLDNLLKSICDICEESGVVANDSHFSQYHQLEKWIAAKNEEPSIQFKITTLNHHSCSLQGRSQK